MEDLQDQTKGGGRRNLLYCSNLEQGHLLLMHLGLASNCSMLEVWVPTPYWKHLFPLSSEGLLGVLGGRSISSGGRTTRADLPETLGSTGLKTRMSGGRPKPRFPEIVISCNVGKQGVQLMLLTLSAQSHETGSSVLSVDRKVISCIR